MSSDRISAQNYPPQEKQAEGTIKSENSSQLTSENPISTPETQSESPKNLRNADRGNEEDDSKVRASEEKLNDAASSLESEKTILEEEDLCRTPTSSDHRIPAMKQCPPAPKKSRYQRSKLKRQASPSCRQRLQFDAAAFELMILPINRDNVVEQKTKRARIDDDGI